MAWPGRVVCDVQPSDVRSGSAASLHAVASQTYHAVLLIACVLH